MSPVASSNLSRVWRLLTALAVIAIGASGCAIFGGDLAMDPASGRGLTPVPAGHESEIEHGTPVRVGLPDGGSVRGVWLGTVRGPALGDSTRSFRLGVGNRPVIDRLFTQGLALVEPTSVEVPETLVFVPRQVSSLAIPVSRGRVSGDVAAIAAGGATTATLSAILIWTAVAAGALTLVGLMFGGH
ncbi:MAG: hypothetical protein RL760_1331 [Candidatus Eisenbacteria bacterium]